MAVERTSRDNIFFINLPLFLFGFMFAWAAGSKYSAKASQIQILHASAKLGTGNTGRKRIYFLMLNHNTNPGLIPMMRLLTRTLLVAAATLMLAACALDYEEIAAKRARNYALEYTKDIPETKRDYIRYTEPGIRLVALMRVESEEGKSKDDLVQACFVWKIPGYEEDLVVSGVSERRLAGWYPVRASFITPDPLDKNKAVAIDSAVHYVMNKMLYLSDTERNRVRFALPVVVSTSFALSLKEEEGDKDEKRIPWMDWKLSKEKEKKKKDKPKVQNSFVWDGDKPGSKIVVSGVGEFDFLNWMPSTGQLINAQELEQNTVK
ncbi:MAG: hypothetical protein A2X49_12190 [Lentisphaerae bacterium GWF2_52_8]|nr:MAG: hypothetical protein A2X49_12190 [Lentisphaerae bacterium GWF2_52_8]